MHDLPIRTVLVSSKRGWGAVWRIHSLRAGERGAGKTNRKILGLHAAAGEGNVLVFEFRPFLVWHELTWGRTIGMCVSKEQVGHGEVAHLDCTFMAEMEF